MRRHEESQAARDCGASRRGQGSKVQEFQGFRGFGSAIDCTLTR